MSTFYITYWTGSRMNGKVPMNAILSEILTVSGSSGQSGVTPANAEAVSIFSDIAANFLIGTDPTASATTSHHIGANERIWVGAQAGSKIAGITT